MIELDRRIRCGVTLPGLSRGSAQRDAEAAERLGFDSLWVTDHIAFYIPVADPVALLGFAAAATERMTLGTSIFLLPLRHPTLVAKQFATLDVLATGRLILGVGIGGEYPPEFEASGVSIRTRGSRADEAIELIRRLWSEESAGASGRHFRFPEIRLEPRPHRVGGPPIWVGGRAEAAIRRAGTLGDGYISHMTSPARFAANLRSIEEQRRNAGRGSEPFGTGAFLFTVIDDSYDAAHQLASQSLGRVYNQPFEQAARKYCLLGPPDACVEQLRRFAEAGVRHFILAPLADRNAFEEAAPELLRGIRGIRLSS